MLVLYIQVRDPVTGQTRQQEFQFAPEEVTDDIMSEMKKQIVVWASELQTDVNNGPAKLTDLGKASSLPSL